jgi:folate-dependent phosphoribosylglycinamide formyltransferase PurN
MTAAPGDRNRVVILTAGEVWHRNTCATLIDAGVNVVGICIANQQSGGLPLKYIRQSFSRRGILTTTSQILGRLYYNRLNRSADREKQARIFDRERIEATLAAYSGPIHHTPDYSAPETLDWLRALGADLFVVHSGYWVGKKVRALPKKGIVIGGHPGLTPDYRGSHSAFWAIYNAEPQRVGCSVFWLDEGVDTGDLVVQETIPIEPGDSYFTLGWKGMKRIAELQAKTVVEFDRGIPIPRLKHPVIPPGSEYPVPTLGDYLRYRRRQAGPIRTR